MDCSIVFEVTDKEILSRYLDRSVLDTGPNVIRPYWEMVVAYTLPRFYDLFDRLQDEGIGGYPQYADERSVRFLDEYEEWGTAWLPYTRYKDIVKEVCGNDEGFLPLRKDFLKGKECRVIYKFDN